MNRKRILKGIATILGAIFVGALGSGVWQSILSPMLRFARNWILDLASLGVESYRDEIYRQIATGLSGNANLRILFLSSVIFGGLLIAIVQYFFMRFSRIRDRHRDMLEELEKDKQGFDQVKITREGLEGKLEAAGHLIKSAWRGIYLLMGLVALAITLQIMTFASVSYVNSATSHYQQVLKIASPYLDDNERLLVESKFAQIQNRQGYVEIVDRLASVARQHGQFVPDFQPW